MAENSTKEEIKEQEDSAKNEAAPEKAAASEGEDSARKKRRVDPSVNTVAEEHGFDIVAELDKLPQSPGVYLMHGLNDEVLYVGKAVKLRNRVRQYFANSRNKRLKIYTMTPQVTRFETIQTDSEVEALVLECNLIKEYRPKYNTKLMDDKAYPFICLTVQEPFPRIQYRHHMKKDKAQYFGPYPDSGAAKEAIDVIRSLYRVRNCNRKLPEDIGKERPCLYYQIHQCDAPCAGLISQEDYQKQVQEAIRFLNGHPEEALSSLKEKMKAAAEDLNFESAASYRDLIESVRKISERQKATAGNGDDTDVIAIAVRRDAESDGDAKEDVSAESAADAKEDVSAESAAADRNYKHSDTDENTSDGSIVNSGVATAGESAENLSAGDAIAQVFFVRDGKLIGRDHFYLKVADGQTKSDIMQSFVQQYYAGTPFIPHNLMLSDPIDDAELIEQWLTQKKNVKGLKVHVLIPKRGSKEKLVDLAQRNAELILSQNMEKIRRDAEKTTGAICEIGNWLGIRPPERIESYDISNTSGYQSVGSMVVYEQGRPKKSDYRKFRIKSVEGPNDYASMDEVLTRRFKRGISEDAGFDRLPDLILMDGGKGQVNIALSVLDKLGLSIPVAGMVKDDHHRTRGLYFNNVEIPIPTDSEGFHLVTRIQDETHRFAITYHRLLRSKEQVHSVLDDIPNVGPKRKAELVAHYPDLDSIRSATVEDMAALPGFNKKAAQSIYDYFHRDNADE
jgi:excinuclease ABC subunit C